MDRVRQRCGQLALLRITTDQQVQRQSAPGRLEYPHGETGSSPIVVARRGLRPRPQRIARRRRREDRQGAVDPRKHERHDSRGINYWESADGRDQRLIFAMNSLLQELDAKTGKSIMTFGTNGVVDLRTASRPRPATSAASSRIRPGEVFENLIILGCATGEGYMSPPGDIRAYDVLTGKLVWTFHTVPRPGEFGYDTWPKDAGNTSAA